jgi:hypothetical protein
MTLALRDLAEAPGISIARSPALRAVLPIRLGRHGTSRGVKRRVEWSKSNSSTSTPESVPVGQGSLCVN